MAPFCDGDDVTAAVGGVVLAASEAPRDQFVQRRDDVGPVDARMSTEVRLALGAVLRKGREQPVVVPAKSFGGEGVAE